MRSPSLWGGQATRIASLQPTTFATFPSWRIHQELTVRDLPVFSCPNLASLKADAKIQKTLNNLHRTSNIFLFLTKFYDFSTLMYKKMRIFATHYAY